MISSVIEKLRKIKIGGNKLRQLLIEKIIEANPTTAKISWDDFRVVLSNAVAENGKLVVALMVKPEYKNKYGFSNEDEYHQLGYARFYINMIPMTDFFHSIGVKKSYTDIDEFNQIYDEILRDGSGIPGLMVQSRGKKLNGDRFSRIMIDVNTIPTEPDVTKYTISYLTGKNKHIKDLNFEIIENSAEYFDVEYFNSVMILLDGSLEIQYTGSYN